MGQLQYADEKEVLKELEINKKGILSLLNYPNPDTLWDNIAIAEGYELSKKIEDDVEYRENVNYLKGKEDFFSALCSLESFNERDVAICEGKNEVYTKDFDKEGGERVCGLDRLVGILHTHPSGAVRPSAADVNNHIEGRHKILCISSPETNACWFTDPPEAAKAIPNIDVEYGNYTNKVYEINADFFKKKRPKKETVEILPRAMIKGIDSAILDMSIKRVDNGVFKGLCFKYKNESGGRCYVRIKDKGAIYTEMK